MSIEYVHFKCKSCFQPLFTVKNSLIQLNNQTNTIQINNSDLGIPILNRQIFCYECYEILGIIQERTNKIEFFRNKLFTTGILSSSNNWN